MQLKTTFHSVERSFRSAHRSQVEDENRVRTLEGSDLPVAAGGGQILKASDLSKLRLN